MAGRIPQHFIDELMSRVDIVEVIDERVPLKKAGRDYKACCPFHTEKTPSFTVSAGKQFYHCFGCGAHGTAVGFLMDYAHMEFPEAIEELAARVGLEVPREATAAAPAGEDTAPLYAILERAEHHYRRELREHPRAGEAVAYLKRRGLSGETAAAFHLGYAPPGWDGLLRALGHDEADRRLLARAGLTLEREGGGGAYDRFRNRIVFPIHDRRGRVAGFGARVLDDALPKYLNSPETPVFHKGRELYGLWQARHSNRRLPRILVVEGYMDVVALAEHGIGYAVATLGTAATAEHVERLFRTAPEVVFCFDGDAAGRQAAWRALETALGQLGEGRRAAFMFLPEGEDPDDAVRARGREAFEAELAEAVPAVTFLYQHLLEDIDTATLDGRARLVEAAAPLLGRLPAGPLRDMALGRLAELSGMEVADLRRHVRGGPAPAAARRRTPRRPPGRGRAAPSLVRRVVALLLHRPSLAACAGDCSHLRGLEQPGIPVLLELLELLAARPNLSTGAVLEHFRDRETGTHLARLAAEAPPPLEEGLEEEFRGALERLARKVDEQHYERLARKAREGGLSAAEKQEFSRLLARLGGRGTPPAAGERPR